MKTKLLILCAATVLAAPTMVPAQNNPPPPPERPNFERLREEMRNMSPEERQAKMREFRERYAGQGGLQPGMMIGRAEGGLERINAVLTPDQRQSIRDAMAENREKTAALEEKLREARRAVLVTALDSKFDESAMRAKLEAVAKLDADLTILRAKAFAKIEPPLSAEQIEQIKSAPPMGQMLRERPGTGGPEGGAPGQPPRGPGRAPRPVDGPPRDKNDLPPPARP